jgi:hypothetical protein
VRAVAEGGAWGFERSMRAQGNVLRVSLAPHGLSRGDLGGEPANRRLVIFSNETGPRR